MTTELFQQTPPQIKQNKQKMLEIKNFILKMKQTALGEMRKWIQEGNDYSADFRELERVQTPSEGVEEVVSTMKRVCLKEMKRVLASVG